MSAASRATGRLRVSPLRPRDRGDALRYLERAPRLNLVLIDLVLRLGGGARRGEPRPELLAAWRDGELVGMAALQPTLVLDAHADPAALEALVPAVASVGSGLVKSTPDVVDPLWRWLEDRGRRALLDRIETLFVLERGARAALPAPHASFEPRPARPDDLDALVVAARASLLEEQRPDPFRGDPVGFRRWVRTRLPRATVVAREGRVGFVGYADVQCPRGWLLQGIYTWPEVRRQGFARAGVGALCERAFEAGADHVQLAVVEGNEEAEGLYARLGFRRCARLRTLLFA